MFFGGGLGPQKKKEQKLLCPAASVKKGTLQVFDEFLLGPTRIARTSVAKVAMESGAENDDQLNAVLAAKARSILALDPSCHVELALFAALCGENSEKRLLDAVLAMMPTATKRVGAQTFCQNVQQLMRTQMFTYDASSAKNKVAAVQKWIERIVADRPPEMKVADECPLLREIAFRFSFFLAKTITVKGTTTEHSGEAALEIIMGETQKLAEEGQATLLHTAPLVVWAHLFKPEAAKKALALVSSVEAAWTQSGKPSKMAKKSSSKASASGSKKAEGELEDDNSENAVKRAMSIFGQ